MIAIRHVHELGEPQIEQLAAVMDSDEAVSRLAEFRDHLREEFAALDPARKAYLVAEEDRRIVGFLRLWHSPHIDEWVNDGMVVRPTHRRRGISRRLLEEALRLAAELGADAVVAHIAEGNIASRRLHEAVGFRVETTEYRNSYGQSRSGWGWQYRVALRGQGRRGTDL